MEINLRPIGRVTNSRRTTDDDHWESIVSDIELEENIPTEAFENISAFSHLEIIFFFDRVTEEEIVFSGRPRGRSNFPLMGIFGQRKKDRPNRLGLATVEILEHDGRKIKVKYLDAIDGTPILDIKPVFREFQPKNAIRQPTWVADLMSQYWK